MDPAARARASSRTRSTASTWPAASPPTSTSATRSRSASSRPWRRAHRQGRQRLAPRARASCCSRRSARAPPGGAGRADRAHRARDHARLLRAVRRRLPVQAPPGRRAGRPPHDGLTDHLPRRCDMPGGPVATRTTALHHHRRERPHDAHRPAAGPARPARRGRARVDRASHDESGRERCLPIPDEEKRTQEYEEGRVKHVRSAVRPGDRGRPRPRRPASTTCASSRRARSTPAPPSSTSTWTSTRIACPSRSRRCAGSSTTLAPRVGVPLSIDSSNLDIIRTGLEAAAAHAGRADAQLGLAGARRGARARRRGRRPGDRDGGGRRRRCRPAPPSASANASAMVERALAKGIPLDLHLRRPARLPDLGRRDVRRRTASTRSASCARRYGPEIHITGGMSNVSFGIP